MSLEQAVGILIGVVVAGLVRFLADRFPTPQQARRRELEDRLLEAQIEKLEQENEEEA
jgi:hypothetical protein